MKAFLDGIRTPKPGGSFTKQFLITVAILAFGFALGVLQKWMDGSAGNLFPPFLQQLDLVNFFGRLGIWIVLGTALSVYAPSPLGASLRTAGFFLSMVAGYFLYCNYGLGFLPKTYMMMWIIAACLSCFPAYVAWYAKGEGLIAILLSSGILGVLLAQAVSLTHGFMCTTAWRCSHGFWGCCSCTGSPRSLPWKWGCPWWWPSCINASSPIGDRKMGAGRVAPRPFRAPRPARKGMEKPGRWHGCADGRGAGGEKEPLRKTKPRRKTAAGRIGIDYFLIRLRRSSRVRPNSGSFFISAMILL